MKLHYISHVLSYLTDYCRHCQIVDDQLTCGLTQSLWNGMVPILVGIISCSFDCGLGLGTYGLGLAMVLFTSLSLVHTFD